MVSFRLDKPAHVRAAVTAVTPHRVCPYLPLAGHHLKLAAASPLDGVAYPKGKDGIHGDVIL